MPQDAVDALIKKLRTVWHFRKGDPDIKVHIRLNRDGYLVGEPEFTVEGNGSGGAVAMKRLADGLAQAQPYNLPVEYYDLWESLDLVFGRPFESGTQKNAPSTSRTPKQDDKSRLAQLGYALMSANDFKLDIKGLAAQQTRVALSGYYLKLGASEYIFPSVYAIGMMRQTYNFDTGVGLLTDGADRDTRKRFLECQQHPSESQIGCGVNVLGRASLCISTMGVDKIPCLDVERLWWPNAGK